MTFEPPLRQTRGTKDSTGEPRTRVCLGGRRDCLAGCSLGGAGGAGRVPQGCSLLTSPLAANKSEGQLGHMTTRKRALSLLLLFVVVVLHEKETKGMA